MKSSNNRFLHDRLIIFGRYPVPGKTKTRLIPTIGPAGAADLQRRLTEKTLETVNSFATERSMEVEFCFEGGNRLKMRRWLGSDIILSEQGQGDLGERMEVAFLEAFRAGCGRVVLMGTDIPELRSDHLKETLYALMEYDLVLGPSTDGGYWLIGLKHTADLFQGVSWGTEKVLGQTVALANQQGIKIHLLQLLSDIDTEEDLSRWRPDETVRSPYLSIIIPALNEGANIEETINRARSDDTEIIVVDGGSSDDTVKRSIMAGVQVESSLPSRAIQQNMGAKQARGKVLLFLHADTHLPDGYVLHIFDALMDPKTVVGAFRFKTDLNHPLMKVIEFVTNIRSHYLRLPYGDQCLFMRKQVFDSVSGFPQVPIAEDLFLIRLLAKRGSVSIVPAYVVTSARRWRTLGLFRTTLVNQIILAGYYLGVPPQRLASFYRRPRRK